MAEFQSTVELRADTGQLTAKLAKATAGLKGVEGQIKKTQGAYTKMGKKVSNTFSNLNDKIKEHRNAIAGIGISLGLVVSKGVKDFKEFEDGIAQIATLGVKDLKKVEKQLDSLRKEYGVSANEATKGYYDVISAGASEGAEAVAQLTAATALAKAGNTDLAGAIDVVTSGMNIFSDNGETAVSITDKLFLAVKFGKTTVEELGQTFGFVAPVVDAAGLSMADYAASMATVTAGGIATKQATTGLKAILSNIIKVTPKAAKKAKELGLEFNTTALQTKGMVGFLQDIKDKTGGSVDELGHLFDSIEAINAVAVLTSDKGLGSIERNFNAMTDAGGTTADALEKVKATASFNFGKFNESMSIMSKNIGGAVIPALLDMADAMGPVVDFFAALIAKNPGIVKITAAVLALGVAFAWIGGPFTIALTATVAAVGALLKEFGAFEEGGVAALEKMKLAWSNFIAGFSTENVGKTIRDLKKDIEMQMQLIISYIENINWDTVFAGIDVIINDVKRWFFELYDAVIGHSYIPDLVNGIKDWFSKLTKFMVEPAQKAIDTVSSLFGSLTSDEVTKKISISVEGQEVLGTITKTVDGLEDRAINLFGEENVEAFKVKVEELFATAETGAKTVAAAVVAIWAGPKVLAAMGKFKNSFKSMTDVGGKQGLMNKLIYGTEGTARNFAHQTKLAKKEIASIADARTLQSGGQLQGKVSKARLAAANKLATIETNILDAKLEKQTSLVKRHAALTAENTKGRGAFSRLLFGKGNADTVRAKAKGLTGQINKGFTGVGANAVLVSNKIKALNVGNKVRGGVLGAMMLGDKGLQGHSTRMKAGAAVSSAGLGRVKLAALKSHISGGLFGRMVFGKGGLVAMKEKMLAMSASFSASVKKMTLAKAGKLGLIGAAIFGTAAAASEAGAGQSIMDSIKNISFEGLKEKATNFMSEYGQEGLMMWMMFGAPGLSALAGIGSTMFATMKGGLAALAAKIGAILAPLGASILSGPVGWIALGAAAAGALTYAYWDDIKPFFTKMWEDTKGWFSNLDFSQLWVGMSDGVSGALDAVKQAFEDWWNRIKGSIPFMGEGKKSTTGRSVRAQNKADGGLISGPGTGRSDSIPANLSNGEFVMNADSTSENRSLLEGLNNGESLTDWLGGDYDARFYKLRDMEEAFSLADMLPNGVADHDIFDEIEANLGNMSYAEVLSALRGKDHDPWAVLQRTANKVLDDFSFNDALENMNAPTTARMRPAIEEYMHDLSANDLVENFDNPKTTLDDMNNYLVQMMDDLAYEFDEAYLEANSFNEGGPVGAENLTDWLGGDYDARFNKIRSMDDAFSLADMVPGGIPDHDLFDEIESMLGQMDYSEAMSAVHGVNHNPWKVLQRTVNKALDDFSFNDMLENMNAPTTGRMRPAIEEYMNDLSANDLVENFDDPKTTINDMNNYLVQMMDDLAYEFDEAYLEANSFANGGKVSGPGGPREDKIPAMLSDGEFVVNAAATSKNRGLLEMINAKKFADGGAADGSVGAAKSFQFLQFKDDKFDFDKTMEMFVNDLSASAKGVKETTEMLEFLRDRSNKLGEEQILNHDYTKRINRALLELQPKKKAEAEVTTEATGAVKDLGKAATDLTSEFKGFGEALTGPIKEAFLDGGSIGDGFKKGANQLFRKLSGKFLDAALSPLEKGLEEGLDTLFSDPSLLNGVGDSISGLFSGFGGGSSGGGIGGMVSGLFSGGGGGIMDGIGSFFGFSKGGVVPKRGMSPQYFANGGFAKGTDTVPAMLTPGEMVLNADQQKNLGGSVAINQTVNITEAMDPQKFQQELVKNNKVVVGLVQQSYQKRGQQGPQGYGQ